MSAEMKDRVNWIVKLITMAVVGGTALYLSGMAAEIKDLRSRQDTVIEMKADIKYLKEGLDELKALMRPQWPPAAKGN